MKNRQLETSFAGTSQVAELFPRSPTGGRNEMETGMKLGDVYTLTVGRDAPARASHVAAMATSSLHLVVVNGETEPVLPSDLDAIVKDMWTMTANLQELAERLAEASVEPRTREALTAAKQALGEARRALFQADPEAPV